MSYDDVDFDDSGNIIVFDGGDVRLHAIGRVRIDKMHLPVALQHGWTETSPPYRYDDGTLLVWRSNEEMLKTKQTDFLPPSARRES